MKCNRLVGTTIFASCKTKHRLFLVVCKNRCTFAAILVFLYFYSLESRSDARMVIVKVHNTIGISSDAHSFFFFLLQKETMKNFKYFTKMFGAFRNTYYICHVKRLPVAIRVSFPRGQDHIDTTQKR